MRIPADDKGILFANYVTSDTARPVMLDLRSQLTGDTSASTFVFGESGGDRSVLLKALADVHDRGDLDPLLGQARRKDTN